MSANAHVDTPDSAEAFAFTAENRERAQRIVARYPEGRQQSAVMPLLDLAQRQNGNWLPRSVMDYVADFLEMPRIRVYEVATFYTMYNKAPVGRHLIQVCRTTPCWLCGSDDLVRRVKEKVGIGIGQTSDDGEFTLVEVECLGACVNAPMVQINDDYFEDLDPDRLSAVLDALARGENATIGSQTGRCGSEPEGGSPTLEGWRDGKIGMIASEPTPDASTQDASAQHAPPDEPKAAEVSAATAADSASANDTPKLRPRAAKPAAGKATTKKPRARRSTKGGGGSDTQDPGTSKD